MLVVMGAERATENARYLMAAKRRSAIYEFIIVPVFDARSYSILGLEIIA